MSVIKIVWSISVLSVCSISMFQRKSLSRHDIHTSKQTPSFF